MRLIMKGKRKGTLPTPSIILSLLSPSFPPSPFIVPAFPKEANKHSNNRKYSGPPMGMTVSRGDLGRGMRKQREGGGKRGDEKRISPFWDSNSMPRYSDDFLIHSLPLNFSVFFHEITALDAFFKTRSDLKFW